MIETRGLSYNRGGRSLVRDVSLEIGKGLFTVIAGPNGAGKSTLLRLLSGELSPTDGEVIFNGSPIRAIPSWRLAHARAVMPQASDLSFPFTALEIANLGIEGIGRGLSRSERSSIALEALERADVVHLAHRNYQTLSGGERQRVHFARALAQLKTGRSVEPRQALFLDEPIASLDLKHQLSLLQEARRLAHGGLTVVAVLHDLQLAASICDDLVLINAGEVVACGSASEVLTPSRLRGAFGVRLTLDHWPRFPWSLA
ncbi:heme ABC transporter ATP-binding protein [Microvirga flavescens]|uniref:heme ABC transporter ATP-binding protein n=1 Tax=Microvirga flavescens TaxID=2249811 RepID=UPI001FE1B890|nr:heme ABC transporter ATP-binding protein [Microvirga flavescens]